MTESLKLPVGIDDFEKIRKDRFYYVDKTKLIEQLLESWGEVNLFTRPRRFGKTLNMSMLRYFFEIGTDKTLFDGLYISKNKKLCEKYMGKFPVVFVSLKNVDGLTFEEARYRFIEVVSREARRFQFLLDSDRLTEDDKNIYKSLIFISDGQYSMDVKNLASALRTLSELLYKHYGQKTIILIDEYDVPLDKAFQHGYYREMVSLIRGMFGDALKTNWSLQFAVLTGCLRVSKESIFTGLNNFKVLSITDARFDEHFGFTDEEVKKLLEAYNLESHLSETKEWYDGYRFGDADIYCPWDVINHVDRLCGEPEAEPQSYWINTSGNELVKRFIDKADQTTRDEIEQLLEGKTIEKSIRLDLTYDEIDNSINNLWSVLFTTGYLTYAEKTHRGIYKLKIPNLEVREVFILQIQEWFKKKTLSDSAKINRFCEAFPEGDTSTIQEMLNDYLWDSISVRDTAVRMDMKENFYHGLVLGLLRSQESWLIRSNAETGEGYSDISVSTPERTGIIIELKYANDGKLETACAEALRQIEKKKYAIGLQRRGMKKVVNYGIAFCEKECMVVMG